MDFTDSLDRELTFNRWVQKVLFPAYQQDRDAALRLAEEATERLTEGERSTLATAYVDMVTQYMDGAEMFAGDTVPHWCFAFAVSAAALFALKGVWIGLSALPLALMLHHSWRSCSRAREKARYYRDMAAVLRSE